jgi:hypothetical protein
MSFRSAPRRVSLRVRDEDRPAEPIEILGHRAALRLNAPVEPDAPVAVVLGWEGGTTTTLAGSVRSVSRRQETLHVAHVDVSGVGGDWREFLAYLGNAVVPAVPNPPP